MNPSSCTEIFQQARVRHARREGVQSVQHLHGQVSLQVAHPAPRSYGMLYEDDERLADLAADHLSAGIERAAPILVIATPAHREAIVRRLASTGQDLARATLLDARESLAQILV